MSFFSFTPDSFSIAEWPFSKNFFLNLDVAAGSSQQRPAVPRVLVSSQVAGPWAGFCLDGHLPSCTKKEEFGRDQARIASVELRAPVAVERYSRSTMSVSTGWMRLALVTLQGTKDQQESAWRGCSGICFDLVDGLLLWRHMMVNCRGLALQGCCASSCRYRLGSSSSSLWSWLPKSSPEFDATCGKKSET